MCSVAMDSSILIALMSSEKDGVRIDLWLWSARFFKTRSQAQSAIKGGKVSLNGQRVKPAKEIHLNDRLIINKNDLSYTIDVRGLSEKRLSAPLAQALYEETPESEQAREDKLEQMRLERHSHTSPITRPDKRQRRKLRELLRGSD